MSGFRCVPTDEFSPLFDRIANEWMLISASDGKVTNSMTASWGCFGILWGKRVAVCFIRPQRYTYEITERTERLSLAFFDEEHHKALGYMGTNSGRDGDKYAATGLHMTAAEDGTPYPAEARVVVLCRKLYAGRLQKSDFLDTSVIDKHYPADDYHQMYVCEIERVLIREDNT